MQHVGFGMCGVSNTANHFDAPNLPTRHTAPPIYHGIPRANFWRGASRTTKRRPYFQKSPCRQMGRLLLCRPEYGPNIPHQRVRQLPLKEGISDHHFPKNPRGKHYARLLVRHNRARFHIPGAVLTGWLSPVQFAATAALLFGVLRRLWPEMRSARQRWTIKWKSPSPTMTRVRLCWKRRVSRYNPWIGRYLPKSQRYVRIPIRVREHRPYRIAPTCANQPSPDHRRAMLGETARSPRLHPPACVHVPPLPYLPRGVMPPPEGPEMRRQCLRYHAVTQQIGVAGSSRRSLTKSLVNKRGNEPVNGQAFGPPRLLCGLRTATGDELGDGVG